MSVALVNIENQISLISLNEQINLMAFLANAIKMNTESILQTKPNASDRIGVAKGKFIIGDDIDFCNDEIAEMFGAS